MIYHYTAWSFSGWMAPDSLLSVLGYYGVSAFFAISGISLAIAYKGRMASKADIGNFLKRRFFRIAPLYWVAITLTIASVALTKQSLEITRSISWFDLVANYTLAFSLFGPSKSLVTGGWSIGNEVFFYLCFPAIFWMALKSKRLMLVAVAVSLTLFAMWGFWYVPMAGASRQDAWNLYISNPNQLLFFVVGVVIGLTSAPRQLGRSWLIAAAAAAIAMLSLASVGERGELVEGWNRVYLSSAILILVFCVYQINWASNSLPGRILSLLGLISYSLYLLHPIVRTVVSWLVHGTGLHPLGVVLISVVVTLIVSWLSYKYVELPGIRLGRSWGGRREPAAHASP